MADILLDNQSAPSTPSSGKSVWWADTTTKKGPIHTDDAGHHYGLASRNFMTAASQSISASTDTYISSSGLLIPSFGMQTGQMYRWVIHVSKTAAGTAAAVLTIRIGSNQSTADTSRLALTQTTAQAAVADSGQMLVTVYPTVVSASGILAGAFGFATGAAGFKSGKDAQSSTFDNSALAGQYIGLSVNTGSSAAWTITGVHAEAWG